MSRDVLSTDQILGGMSSKGLGGWGVQRGSGLITKIEHPGVTAAVKGEQWWWWNPPSHRERPGVGVGQCQIAVLLQRGGLPLQQVTTPGWALRVQ